jgi:hypothetical protein
MSMEYIVFPKNMGPMILHILRLKFNVMQRNVMNCMGTYKTSTSVTLTFTLTYNVNHASLKKSVAPRARNILKTTWNTSFLLHTLEAKVSAHFLISCGLRFRFVFLSSETSFKTCHLRILFLSSTKPVIQNFFHNSVHCSFTWHFCYNA